MNAWAIRAVGTRSEVIPLLAASRDAALADNPGAKMQAAINAAYGYLATIVDLAPDFALFTQLFIGGTQDDAGTITFSSTVVAMRDRRKR